MGWVLAAIFFALGAVNEAYGGDAEGDLWAAMSWPIVALIRAGGVLLDYFG